MKLKTSFYKNPVLMRNVVWMVIMTLIVTLMNIKSALEFSSACRELVADGYNKTESFNYKMDYLSTYLDPGWMSSFIFFLLGLFMAMIFFRFMFGKRSTDMHHAMPLTRRELFLAGVLPAIPVFVIPSIVNILAFEAIASDIKGATSVILLATAKQALLGIMGYSITVLMIMITGVWILPPVLTLIFNFLYIYIKSMALLILDSVVYGGAYAKYILDVAGITSIDYCLSPSVFLTHYYKIGVDFEANKVVFSSAGFLWYFLAAALILSLAYFAYGRRQMETTGDYLTKSWLKTFFTVGITGCAMIGIMAIMVGSQKANLMYTMVGKMDILICLLAAFACYMLISMAIHKTIRVFIKKHMVPAAIWSVALTAAFAFVEMDCANLSGYQPDREDIVWATADIFSRSSNSEYADITDVDSVMALQNEILANKKEFIDGYAEGRSGISVVIKYFDGKKTVIREYMIPYFSDSFEKNDFFAKLDREYNNPADDLSLIYDNMTANVAVLEYYRINDEGEYEYESVTLDQDKAACALLKDLKAGSIKWSYPGKALYNNKKNDPYKGITIYDASVSISYTGEVNLGEDDYIGLSSDYAWSTSGYIGKHYLTGEGTIYININNQCENLLAYFKEAGVDVTQFVDVEDE